MINESALDYSSRKIEKIDDIKTLYDYGVSYFSSIKNLKFIKKYDDHNRFNECTGDSLYCSKMTFYTIVDCIVKKHLSTYERLTEYSSELYSPTIIGRILDECAAQERGDESTERAECKDDFDKIRFSPDDNEQEKFLASLRKSKKYLYEKNLKEFMGMAKVLDGYNKKLMYYSIDWSLLFKMSNTFNEFLTMYIECLKNL